MIVCCCTCISEKQLRHAIAEGAHTLSDVQKTLPVGKNCGTCIPEAEAIIESTLASKCTAA
jgi:bacterioferritin-associated ferredoxin